MRAWLAAHVFAVVAGKIDETTSRGAVPATLELAHEILFARVAELVDAADLKSVVERCVGSSPFSRTLTIGVIK